MTSFRQYRNSLSYDYALTQLKEGRNSQFDSKVVDAFLRVLLNYDIIKKELAWTVPDQQ
jgi:HD-GYP domain-containing protein (c-di-GMP phosphodiesterase class II)